MTDDSENQTVAPSDPFAQAIETFAAATSMYAESMQALMMASTGMMLGTLQHGAEAGRVALGSDSKRPCDKNVNSAGDAETVRHRAFQPPQISPAGRSWYRPPVQHPFLEMIDDAMKPWRTFVPDHSASTLAGRGTDVFGAERAAEFMAAYHTGTGFTMAHISFPDEKSVCVTLPAPWAFLTQR